MTLPNPGVSLSIQQIYNEAQVSPSSPWYNKGYGLGAYRGIQWWKDNGDTGYFPNTAISINDFYSKRSTTPVSAGTKIIAASTLTNASGTGSVVTITYTTSSSSTTNIYSVGDVIQILSSSNFITGNYTVTGTPANNQITINSTWQNYNPFNPLQTPSATFCLLSFVIPLYSNITFTARGGAGGGSGGSGNYVGGSPGGDGTTTTLTNVAGTVTYSSADYGRGGTSTYSGGPVNGAAGAGSDGSPAGGAGGSNGVYGTAGGAGGAGGKTVSTYKNPVSGGSGPAVGTSVKANFGLGGAGAAGGGGTYANANYYCGAGGDGGNGYVVISWS